MNELIKLIFKSYNFACKWNEENIEFYKNTDSDMVSYFFVSYIDGTGVNENAEYLLEKLKSLEKQYINDGDKVPIKRIIQSLFDNEREAAQIDKNTSAVFPIKLKNLDSLDKYKNLIYTVEESPYHFRRFVIPYTDCQVDELMKIICDNKEKEISEVLSDIANDEEAYYDLASYKNLNNVYELVIRLFSKIPFLRYSFKAEQKPMTIEERIELEMQSSLKIYHDSVKRGVEDINELLELSDYVPDDEQLEEEINVKLRGVKNVNAI